MSATTIREGRQRYFDEFGLGEGGYDDEWVHLKLGPIPFVIPNTESRKRAVRIHDLHHVVTGYRADWIGEFEISAWEVGSSCRHFWAAWVLNLWGLAAGTLVAPSRVLRAFTRGRHSRNLYAEGFSEGLLEESVASVTERLRLDEERSPTAGDRAAFALWAGLAWVFTGLSFALLLSPLVALGVALYGAGAAAG